jgi:hypothetical protein
LNIHLQEQIVDFLPKELYISTQLNGISRQLSKLKKSKRREQIDIDTLSDIDINDYIKPFNSRIIIIWCLSS